LLAWFHVFELNGLEDPRSKLKQKESQDELKNKTSIGFKLVHSVKNICMQLGKLRKKVMDCGVIYNGSTTMFVAAHSSTHNINLKAKIGKHL
jgi:hypothetical protein